MDPLPIIIAVATLVLGVPIAYVVGRRNRQKPDLRSAVDFDVVIGPGEWLTRGDLDITFDGRPLDRVSRTYLALWNHRGDTVRGTEVLPADPLRVVVDADDEILQTRVVSYSRAQIAAAVTNASNDAPVTFEFLDPRDGFILEVMHRGTRAAQLLGTVPGAAITRSRKIWMTRRSRHYIRQPLPQRVVERIRNGGLQFALLLAIVPIVAIYGIWYYGRTLIRAAWPSLVDPADFPIDTLSGQRDFARQVGDVGQPDILLVAASAVAIVAAVGLLVVLLRLFLSRVPRTIAQNDFEPYED